MTEFYDILIQFVLFVEKDADPVSVDSGKEMNEHINEIRLL